MASDDTPRVCDRCGHGQGGGRAWTTVALPRSVRDPDGATVLCVGCAAALREWFQRGAR